MVPPHFHRNAQVFARFAVGIYGFVHAAYIVARIISRRTGCFAAMTDIVTRVPFRRCRCTVPLNLLRAERNAGTLQSRGNWESGLNSRQDEFTAIISQKNCISFTKGKGKGNEACSLLFIDR